MAPTLAERKRARAMSLAKEVAQDVKTEPVEPPTLSQRKKQRALEGMGEGGFGGPRELLEGVQSGFLKGAAGTAGFLSDIPGYALQAAGVELPLQLGPVGYIGEPGHAERYRQALEERRQIYPGEAPTTMGRIGETAGRTSELMGEFAVPLGAAGRAVPVLKAGERLSRVPVARQLPQVANIVLEPYRAPGMASKASQLVRDLGIGAEFGAAAGAVEQGYPEGMPGKAGAELAAGFAGPGLARAWAAQIGTQWRRLATADPSRLPPLLRGGAEAVQRAASGAHELATGETAAAAAARKYEADARAMAAQRLQVAGTEPVGKTLEDIYAYREMAERFPGVELPLAKITGDRAGLGTQMGELYRHSTGFAGQLNRMRAQTEAVLEQDLKKLAPNQSAGAQRISQMVEKVHGREMEALDSLVEMAEQKALQEISAAGGQIAPDQASIRVAQLINETVTPFMRQRQAELYDAIPDTMLSSAPLKRAAKRIENSLSQAEKKKASNLPRALQTIAEYPEEISFSEFRGLRRSINNEMETAAKRGGVPIRLLMDLKDETGRVLDGMMKNHPDAIIASRYREADQYTYRALQHLKDYRAGARVTGLGKGERVPGSAALSQYAHTGPGATEDAQEWTQLMNWMKNTQVRRAPGGELTTMAPEAAQAQKLMEDYLISDAFKSSGIQQMSPRSEQNLQRWMNAHEPILRQFPGVRMRLSNIQSAKRLFDERLAQRAVTEKQYQKSVASDFLRKNVDEAIDAALYPRAGLGKSPGAALQDLLKSAGGTPEAEDGIKRALYDRMMQEAYRDALETGGAAEMLERTPEILFPNNLVRFHKKNVGVLSKWWRPGHVKRLEEIAKLAHRNQLAWEGTTSRPTMELNEKFLGDLTYYRRAMSGWRNTMETKGGVSGRYAAKFLDYLFEAFPREEVIRHLERAHLDDRHAELLYRTVTPEEAAALLRRFSPGRAAGVAEVTREQQREETMQ